MGDFQTIFQSQSFQDGTVGCHRCLRRNPSSEQTLRAGIMADVESKAVGIELKAVGPQE